VLSRFLASGPAVRAAESHLEVFAVFRRDSFGPLAGCSALLKTLVLFALAADPLRPSAERARPDDHDL
jgi:hypothetical protein